MSLPVGARVRAVLNFLCCLDHARTFMAEQDAASAQASRMPELRQFVLAHCLLLYAHGEREVVLLSLRHERHLGCQFRAPVA